MIHAATNKISLATTSKCSKHGHKLILIIDLSYLDFQLSNLEVILEQNEIFSPNRTTKTYSVLFSQLPWVVFIFYFVLIYYIITHIKTIIYKHIFNISLGKPPKSFNNYKNIAESHLKQLITLNKLIVIIFSPAGLNLIIEDERLLRNYLCI